MYPSDRTDNGTLSANETSPSSQAPESNNKPSNTTSTQVDSPPLRGAQIEGATNASVETPVGQAGVLHAAVGSTTTTTTTTTTNLLAKGTANITLFSKALSRASSLAGEREGKGSLGRSVSGINSTKGQLILNHTSQLLNISMLTIGKISLNGTHQGNGKTNAQTRYQSVSQNNQAPTSVNKSSSALEIENGTLSNNSDLGIRTPLSPGNHSNHKEAHLGNGSFKYAHNNATLSNTSLVELKKKNGSSDDLRPVKKGVHSQNTTLSVPLTKLPTAFTNQTQRELNSRNERANHTRLANEKNNSQNITLSVPFMALTNLSYTNHTNLDVKPGRGSGNDSKLNNEAIYPNNTTLSVALTNLTNAYTNQTLTNTSMGRSNSTGVIVRNQELAMNGSSLSEITNTTMGLFNSTTRFIVRNRELAVNESLMPEIDKAGVNRSGVNEVHGRVLVRQGVMGTNDNLTAKTPQLGTKKGYPSLPSAAQVKCVMINFFAGLRR